MKIADIPADDALRIKDLRSYDILDSEKEKDFDDLIELASQICDCPIALISFIDKDRQWFKAGKNIDESETPRDLAFCAHTILQNEVMEIVDLTADERFNDNPFVTGPFHLRFYAGAPIVSSAGYNLGSVCVIDKVNKVELTAAQKNALKIIAAQVTKLLELRTRNKMIVKHAAAQLEAEKKINQLTVLENDQKDKSIAYELHENLAQSLAGTKMFLESAELSKELSPYFLQKSIETISGMIEKIKTLSHTLTPTTFQDADFLVLIEEYAKQFGKDQSMMVTFARTGVLKNSVSDSGLNLFRIVQHMLEIAKNGQAKNIRIAVSCLDEVTLDFNDDRQNEQPTLKDISLFDNINTRVELNKGTINSSSGEGGNNNYVAFPLLAS